MLYYLIRTSRNSVLLGSMARVGNLSYERVSILVDEGGRAHFNAVEEESVV